MKILKKILILVMVLMTTLIAFVKINVKADTLGTEYTQKIVSVVFDNSGSMSSRVYGKDESGTSVELGKRYSYASYALDILISLMNENDKLVITPMNNARGDEWEDKSIQVNLKNETRDEEVAKLFYETTSNKENPLDPNRIPLFTNTSPGTPYGSIDRALVAFSQMTGEQLPSKNDYDESDNKEYWLIILTDGQLSKRKDGQSITLKDKHSLSSELEETLGEYSYLNTIYFAFGNENQIVNLEGTSVDKNLAFTPYIASEGDSIIASMKDIANKLSRRFELPSQNVRFDANKIYVDLNEYSSNYLSFKSISILAQNCNAVLKSVEYSSKNYSQKQIKITRPSILDSRGILNMSNGYLGLLEFEDVFDGGILTLEFANADGTIDNLNLSNENVYILVEPALLIKPLFTHKGEIIDMAYVNSYLTVNDKIKVDYSVTNPVEGSEIGNLDIFGKYTAVVSYCGKESSVGEEISLEIGSNQINIEITFENGYTLLASTLCVVESDPTIHRITSEVFKELDGTPYNNQVKYTVYYNDQVVSKKDLESGSYTISVSVVDPFGKTVSNKYSIVDDKIVVDVNISQQNLGKYEITCKVVYNAHDKISRSNKETLVILPKNLEIQVLSSDVIIGEHNLEKNQESIAFKVVADGKEFYIDSSIFKCKMTIDGVDITDKVNKTKGLFIYIPNSGSLPKDLQTLGKKTVTLTIESDYYKTLTASSSFEIQKTSYKIEVLPTEGKEIDIYNLDNCIAEVRFKIYRNGDPLSVEEVQTLLENGEIRINEHAFGWLAGLPCGLKTFVETVGGEPEIVCKVYNDGISFLNLDNLTASFIFPSEKEIEIRYMDGYASDVLVFTPVSFSSRITKWAILLLYILILLHLVLYVLGFIIREPFPSGYIVSGNISGKKMTSQKPKIKAVNCGNDRYGVLKWHLFRFIPFCELNYQKARDFGGIGEMRFVKGEIRVILSKKDVYKLSYDKSDDRTHKLEEYLDDLKRGKVSTRSKLEFNCDLSKIPHELVNGIANVTPNKGAKKKKEKKIVAVPMWRTMFLLKKVTRTTSSSGRVTEKSEVTRFVTFVKSNK